MNSCEVVGCAQAVSKPGYTLCYEHWKANKADKLTRCATCNRLHEGRGPTCIACANGTPDETDADPHFLSSTKIGQHFVLSNIKVNLILSELGWIERYVKGWVPTDRGNAMGANIREMRNGTPFVVWPAKILQNAALLASVAEQTGSTSPVGSALADHSSNRSAKADPTPLPKSDDFRGKYPAAYTTADGHRVRSRAEVLIDNWLYMQGLVHAYERRLPIEEECYCDFYLPGGKGVYIEYWGLEADPKYRDRKAVKQGLYTKYGLRLIELGDAEIERLDDVLPRMLLRFGIESA